MCLCMCLHTHTHTCHFLYYANVMCVSQRAPVVRIPSSFTFCRQCKYLKWQGAGLSSHCGFTSPLLLASRCSTDGAPTTIKSEGMRYEFYKVTPYTNADIFTLSAVGDKSICWETLDVWPRHVPNGKSCGCGTSPNNLAGPREWGKI